MYLELVCPLAFILLPHLPQGIMFANDASTAYAAAYVFKLYTDKSCAAPGEIQTAPS